MKEVNLDQLTNVTGGVRSVSAFSGRYDTQMQLLMSQLSNDIRDIARPQQNQMMMMMAALMFSRVA
jgi:hypothetical protein